MKDIEDAEEALKSAKVDTEHPIAVIDRVYVDRRDAVETAINREDSERGLVFTFERPSESVMTRWFPLPATWEPQHDIVALLSYLGWSPDGSEVDLRDLEDKSVPVRHGDDGWELDWGIIGNADLPERAFR